MKVNQQVLLITHQDINTDGSMLVNLVPGWYLCATKRWIYFFQSILHQNMDEVSLKKHE